MRLQVGPAGPAGRAVTRRTAAAGTRGSALADLAEDAGTLPGARRAPLPDFVAPQLATLVSDVPAGDEWLHEIKLDGYRLLARISRRGVRLLSRNGNEWTQRFPAIAEAARGLGRIDLLLDGEAVVLDERGISRFQALQNVLRSGRSADVKYYVFDLLYAGAHDLRRVTLLERKQLLERIVGDGDVIRFTDHIVGRGRAIYEQACRTGLEGIVSKRIDLPYRSGRTAEWLKIKCQQRQELVIVGYTEPKGLRSYFGALVLGIHDADGRLVFAGKVGTGFNEDTLRDLYRRLKPLQRKDPPVVDPPRGAEAAGIHWVEPKLVAEISFTEWTEDGRVRHPSFEGLREDKSAREVVREVPKATSNPKRPTRALRDTTVEIAGVRLTNPDRVLFPDQGLTKADLARHWERVAKRALSHLRDRPLLLLRCPSGRHKRCFYQKHATEGMPDVVPHVSVEEQDGTRPYMYIDGLPAIIALVQFGALELHVWSSRQPRIDRPDQMVFDLDPDEALPWSVVVEAAFQMRARLQELDLENFVKTTGGKGLHVVVPLTRRAGFDEVRAFAQAIAESFARREPSRYTANMSKRGRKGRIFIDYLRNGYNATSIAPYSPRAKEGAPVAVPLDWKELEQSRERPRYTVNDMADRIAGPDPWAGFFDVRQSITATMRRAVGLRT